MKKEQIERLMYGNRIFVRGGMYSIKLVEITVTFLELHAIHTSRVLEAIPIPISESLLRDRCGFIGENTGTAIGKNGVILSRTSLPNGSWVLCYDGLKFPVNFVHELQNIWLHLFNENLKYV